MVTLRIAISQTAKVKSTVRGIVGAERQDGNLYVAKITRRGIDSPLAVTII